ncbi:glycosyltransferase [Klenkia sp. LSe6-5]|uniref:Glycosyltransferase n=1 Tax=Klenkia sesuvii TaxID=3103137 RepID=A0ABU8DQ38_9ACTN
MSRRSRLVVLNWRDRTHPESGAAEAYTERVAREVARRGRPVVVLTSRPRGARRRERVDGYRVLRLGGRWTVYPLALLWLLVHRRSTGAVLDSQNGIPFFSPLVVNRSVPVVLLVHQVHQDVFGAALPAPVAALARWAEGPLTRRVYHRRTVVVPSPTTRVQVRRRLRMTGPVRLVPGGADRARRDVVRAPAPRIVVSGRLADRKGLDQLVTAVAAVQTTRPDLQLHLLGDGPARAGLAALARSQGARVVFHGRVDDERRDQVLGSAWLSVSASGSGDWGLGPIAANALGVPVLALRVPGTTDAIRQGRTGWVVENSAAALTEGIEQALDRLADPEAATRMARRARAWAAQFSWDQTADGVLKAVADEAARRARAAAGDVDRRGGNDLAVVLRVPATAVTAGWEAHRRAGDTWIADGGTVRGLLTGADEADVPAVLDRLGVDRDDPGISVLVARQSDLLGLPDVAADEVLDLAESLGRPVLVPDTQDGADGAEDDGGAGRAA